MSSITRIRTRMVEKEYLLRALEDLGHTWEEGVKLRVAGRQVSIKVKRVGADVGFRRAGRTYEVITGWRGIKLEQFLHQVTQRYAYHAARAKLEEQGFTLVSEQVQEKGQIHLVLRRMA
jgi:hypothetical protein